MYKTNSGFEKGPEKDGCMWIDGCVILWLYYGGVN